MSLDLGLAVLRQDYCANRIPVMEHFEPISRESVIAITQRDPLKEDTKHLVEIYRQVAQWLEVDLKWGGGIPDETRETFDWSDGQTVRQNQKGETVVQWGIFGTVHAEDGRHFHHVPKPAGVTEALAFDPAPYFPETVEELTARFTDEYQRMLKTCQQVCYPIPHYYTTAFHFPLAIFGFELFCEVGMEDERAVNRMMERFAAVSLRITTAWSRVPGLKGMILHDDLTMTSGPIFAPDWYRRHVFCHYPAIFKPFVDRNIPILFTSDGDCSLFVDDIFLAGADGLNFEHWVPLEPLVAKYPDKMLVGNLSSDILAHGTVEQVIQHTKQTMTIGAKARRYVVNVGGQITHDIPLANLKAYVETRKHLAQTLRA